MYVKKSLSNINIENRRLKPDSPLWDATSLSSDRPPAVLEFPEQTQQLSVCSIICSTQRTTDGRLCWKDNKK